MVALAGSTRACGLDIEVERIRRPKLPAGQDASGQFQMVRYRKTRSCSVVFGEFEKVPVREAITGSRAPLPARSRRMRMADFEIGHDHRVADPMPVRDRHRRGAHEVDTLRKVFWM